MTEVDPPFAHFVLPQYCWLDNYYQPMQKRFSSYLKNYEHSELMSTIIKREKEEIRIYEKYKAFYGYGFYITKKNIAH